MPRMPMSANYAPNPDVCQLRSNDAKHDEMYKVTTVDAESWRFVTETKDSPQADTSKATRLLNIAATPAVP